MKSMKSMKLPGQQLRGRRIALCAARRADGLGHGPGRVEGAGCCSDFGKDGL